MISFQLKLSFCLPLKEFHFNWNEFISIEMKVVSLLLIFAFSLSLFQKNDPPGI